MCGILTHLSIISIINNHESFDVARLIYDDLQLDLKLDDTDIIKLENLRSLQIEKENKKFKGKKEKKHSENIQLQQPKELLITPEPNVVQSDEPCIFQNQLFNSLIPKIASRGPDFCRYLKTDDIKTSSTIYHLEQFSSVLSLRQPFVQQPIIDANYNIQYNGELYNPDCLEMNDTAYILKKIEENQDVLKTIGELRGEFAIVIYDLKNQKFYFGRDIIGRRALSYSLMDGELHISSLSPSCTCHGPLFKDCVGGEIYEFDLEQGEISTHEYGTHPELKLAFEMNSTVLNDETLVDQRITLLDEHLTRSVSLRLNTIHPLNEESSTSKANLGILFSGGLDCTLIASKSAQLSQPGTKIDLLTVGFDNPRTNKSASESPDRKLAKKSWFHLSKTYPNINFQLVEVNVSYRDWLANKKRVIKLMYPADTEMDLSIAIAFYFASKGEGIKTVFNEQVNKETIEESQLNDNELYLQEEYKSTAKVLFSGLGADELFGGYTRHERLFNHMESNDSIAIQEAYQQLALELKHDLDVLYVRNLGRDDRAIASWGKELRYPFLDEEFISFATGQLELDLKLKLNFVNSTIHPVRKSALRRLAEIYKLDFVKDEAKRAIQFGAKSAKMEIGQGKTKGTDSL